MDSSHGTKKWIGECDLTEVNKEVCGRAGNCLTFGGLQNLVIPSGTLSFFFFFLFLFVIVILSWPIFFGGLAASQLSSDRHLRNE